MNIGDRQRRAAGLRNPRAVRSLCVGDFHVVASREVGSPAPVMLEQFAADFVYRRRIFTDLLQESRAVLTTRRTVELAGHPVDSRRLGPEPRVSPHEA